MHEQINGTENISPTLHVTKVALQNSKKKNTCWDKGEIMLKNKIISLLRFLEKNKL